MRDGTKLYTVIVMKKGTRTARSCCRARPMTRTAARSANASQRIDRHPARPCTRSSSTTATSSSTRTSAACTGRRARSCMTRPIVGPLNNTGIDESTDAYDTIDWLVKNMPESNGRVGDDRLVLPRLHHADDRDQPAPGAEGGGAAKARWSTAGWATTTSTTAPSASADFDYFLDMSTGKARRRRRDRRAVRATTTRAISRRARQATSPASGASRTCPFVQQGDGEPGLHRLLVSCRRSTSGWPRGR